MNKDIKHDIRICFIGDSVVNGTGDETALGWVGRISAAVHASGKSVTFYNLGIRRDTSRGYSKIASLIGMPSNWWFRDSYKG